LLETVDWTKHRFHAVVNGGTPYTVEAVCDFGEMVGSAAEITFLEKNIGTARAINKAWQFRLPGENVVKMDNDVIIHSTGWVEALESCIERDPKIGIIGLKRGDLLESPDAPDPRWKSEIRHLPHLHGQRWLAVEVVEHVIGTCQMYSAALLDKIGYLCQPGLYGFDYSLAAVRCRAAGFYNCFWPWVEIDHIDPGGTKYTEWKQNSAGADMAEYNRLKDGILTGTIPFFADVNGNLV
jgi:GT2 family glycosyltransferase